MFARSIERLVAATAILLAISAQARGQATFTVPGAGGAVLLEDGETLIVSATNEANLIFFDTTSDKETRRVEVEFKPTAMASQGASLFVAAKGTAAVHILDAANGVEQSVMKLPGEPVIALACHPKKGLLYAVNSANEVFAMDLKSRTSTKTPAKGQLIAVDPAEGKFVYTGIQKPIREELLMRNGPGGSARLSLSKANLRAVMLKYAVDGRSLKLVAANDNAAINGRGMAISADGKQIAMAGGGGWRSLTDSHVTYAIATFATSDMKEILGQIETGPYPVGVAFHPTEKLGAAFHDGNPAGILLFRSTSFAKKAEFPVRKSTQSSFLAFGGKGTKVVYVPLATGGPNDGDSVIEFFPTDMESSVRSNAAASPAATPAPVPNNPATKPAPSRRRTSPTRSGF